MRNWGRKIAENFHRALSAEKIISTFFCCPELLEERPEEGDLVEAAEPGLADDVAAALPGLAASRQRLTDEAGRAGADGTWAVKAKRSSLET